MELLVVLVILSALMGLTFAGLSAWKSRSMYEATLSKIALRMREARNYAVSGSVGSVVEVDSERSTVQSWSFRPVALLSLEDREAVQMSEAAARGGIAFRKGRLGNGADLSGGGELALPHAGGFVGKNGMACRCYIFPLAAPANGGSTWQILKGGSFLSFELRADLSLSLRLGSRIWRTRGRALVLKRWSEVAFRWIHIGGKDRVSLLVHGVDKILRLSGKELEEGGRGGPEEEGQPEVLFPKGFVFGPMEAIIDECEVFSVVAGKRYSIPGEYEIAGPPKRIHFAPSCRLDLRFHDKRADIPVVESGLLRELKPAGKTHVKSTRKPENLPEGAVSHVWVEVSGRIWLEKPGRAGEVEFNGETGEKGDKKESLSPAEEGNG